MENKEVPTVEVKAKSWILDDYDGKILFSVKTNILFKREDKTELMERISKLIANEIENHELLNQKTNNT